MGFPSLIAAGGCDVLFPPAGAVRDHVALESAIQQWSISLGVLGGIEVLYVDKG